MVQVIKSTHVTTETIQGEVTINLNLTITVNQDGSVGVATSAKKPEEKEEKMRFEMPDFDSGEMLYGLGKDV